MIEKILLLIIGFLFLTISFSGCLQQKQETITVTGFINSTGYPAISENIPLCLVMTLDTQNQGSFILTRNQTPQCRFTPWYEGDNVQVSGTIHHLDSYDGSTSYRCLEIQTIRRI